MSRINYANAGHTKNSNRGTRLNITSEQSSILFGDLNAINIFDDQLKHYYKLKIPPNIDIKKNILEAKQMSAFEFVEAVKSGGKWDYKKLGREYQEFGNWHFGLVASAFGFPRNIAKRGAGYYQIYATKTSKKEWGNPWDIGNMSSYGDDPMDQIQIDKGYDAYENQLYLEIDYKQQLYDVIECNESTQIDVRLP